MSLEYVFAEQGPNGEILWALKPESYEKVRLGYACGHCLEDFLGVALLECPTCKRPTALVDPERVMEPCPQEWIDFERETQEALSGAGERE